MRRNINDCDLKVRSIYSDGVVQSGDALIVGVWQIWEDSIEVRDMGYISPTADYLDFQMPIKAPGYQ